MEKIEEFLFDILGLLVPGVVFLLLAILLPVSVLDYSQVDFSAFLSEKVLALLYVEKIFDKLALNTMLSSWIIMAIVIAISYIFGHTIKVFSKYQYDFCKKFFDEGINRVIKYLFVKVDEATSDADCCLVKIFNSQYRKMKKQEQKAYSGLLVVIFGVVDLFIKMSQVVFSFSALDNYEEKMTEEAKNEIKKRFGIEAKSWYTVYKIANVVIAQENLKSLSFKFLAKYNFYRSLAFIFLINGIYIIGIYKVDNSLINPLGHIIFYPMLMINYILWFTFHDKYKRYWTLCGNESVVTLFYFWKTKGKENEQHDEENNVS